MNTLNDIPDYLHEDRIDDWTPERGFVTGVLSTLLAGVAIALLVGMITYYAAPVTTHWFLNAAWGLLIAWILFAVMHKASKLVSIWCAIVVILCTFLVFVAKHVCLLASVAAGQEPAVSAWSLFSLSEMLTWNYPAWLGVGLATAFCWDGESTVHDLADLLMANVFTGRRM